MTERTILFATDYSDASQHALSYACSLARDLDALLLIAHVSEHELYPVGEAFDEKPEPSPQEMEHISDRYDRDLTTSGTNIACSIHSRLRRTSDRRTNSSGLPIRQVSTRSW